MIKETPNLLRRKNPYGAYVSPSAHPRSANHTSTDNPKTNPTTNPKTNPNTNPKANPKANSQTSTKTTKPRWPRATVEDYCSSDELNDNERQ